MDAWSNEVEPHLAGIAILKSDSIELLRKVFTDDEIVEQSWVLLQSAVRMFQARAILNSDESAMGLALPTDLLNNRWANVFLRFSVLNIIEDGGEALPYDEAQTEDVIRIHMTAAQGIIDQIADLDNSSPEEVTEHLHRFMLMNFADEIL